MKKLLKNKVFWIILVIVILLLGVGGFVLVQNQNKQRSEEKAKEEGKSNNAKPTEKTDNPPKDDTQNQNGTVGQTVVNSSLGNLSDVSLTAYLNREASTSLDGKTTIPANSISISFYMPAGVYSIQKLIGSSWQDVATNNNYPGHGGLSVPNLSPSEDNISYRVIKIENGTAKSVSKTFIVKRSDLSDGMKTYN